MDIEIWMKIYIRYKSKGGTKINWTALFKPQILCQYQAYKDDIPNQWKFNEDLAELSKFDIAALIEGVNSV